MAVPQNLRPVMSSESPTSIRGPMARHGRSASCSSVGTKIRNMRSSPPLALTIQGPLPQLSPHDSAVNDGGNLGECNIACRDLSEPWSQPHSAKVRRHICELSFACPGHLSLSNARATIVFTQFKTSSSSPSCLSSFFPFISLSAPVPP